MGFGSEVSFACKYTILQRVFVKKNHKEEGVSKQN